VTKTVDGARREAPAARILVIRNHDVSPPGLLLGHLERRNFAVDMAHPYRGEPLPESPDGYAGLIVLGGPQDAYDDPAAPFLQNEMRLMKSFDAHGRAVAGICLGCQLLARAYGGIVHPMNELEFGFTPLSLTKEGERDPVLCGPVPAIMEYHQDSFTLPPEATLLVTGPGGRPQAFRIGNASYGFQFHLEVDADTVASWIVSFRNGANETYAKYKDRVSPQTIDAMLEKLPALCLDASAFCSRVFNNWLSLASATPKKEYRLTSKEFLCRPE
jgi:GMP synthase-like glutamine amidotransferase